MTDDSHSKRSAWVARSDAPPFAAVRIRSDVPGCVVIIEPVGSDYRLADDDEIVIELASPSPRPEDADVHIVHQTDAITIWTLGEWRAWNKAGEEIL